VRDQFYSDKHDLVKWAILYELANTFGASRIIQIAFYRKSIFPKIIVAGKEYDIPSEVIAHFRDLRKISNVNSKIRVNVFDAIFNEPRGKYLDAVKSFMSSFYKEPCIVFLDPDTGLEPERPGLEHVLMREAAEIWEKVKPGDIYTFYQHRVREKNWIAYMKGRLDGALKLTEAPLKIAHVKIEPDPSKPEKTPDVVFFYAQKPAGGVKEAKINNVATRNMPTRRKNSLVEAILIEDGGKKRIDIDEALKQRKRDYLCPACGKPVIPHQKGSTGGMAHFEHHPGQSCSVRVKT
jgi:hypothetical protein